ncbi:MAG: zinc ribbon domain-containing protein [Clostridiales bacterium]|nr:zinc ribbon domain-containing protein [Clostridiales bacterium]
MKYCSECGHRIPDYTKKCRVCGSEKEESSIFRYTIIALIIIIISSWINGEIGIILQAIVMAVYFIALYRQLLENKKRVIITAIFYYIMWFLAKNNIPEFIRAIPGKDFVGIWLKYLIVLYITAFFVQLIVVKSFAAKYGKNLVDLQYTDSDLMILRGFNRYRMTGYYLTKAKLDRIVRFTQIKEDEETAEKTVVSINPNLSQEDRENYCSRNPQTQKIIAFLQHKEAKEEETTVVDIIHHVIPGPIIQSAGGLHTADLMKKICRRIEIMTLAAIMLAYYLGVTKLIMGMHNGKEIVNLAGSGFIISAVLLAICFALRKKFILSEISDSFTNIIIDTKRNKMPDLEEKLKAATFTENSMAEAEKRDLLRAYATYEDFSSNKTVTCHDGSMSILDAVIAVELAEVAALAAAQAARNDGSGCSACSGCSSCGGCGGCGGCGD